MPLHVALRRSWGTCLSMSEVPLRWQANMAQRGQSGPDFGLGLSHFAGKILRTHSRCSFPALQRSGVRERGGCSLVQGYLTYTRKKKLGLYRRPMRRVLGGFYGGGRIDIGEVPL